MTSEPTLGDLIHADGQRRARLAAAMEAVRTAPSATETPGDDLSGHPVALQPEEGAEARQQAATVLAHIRDAIDEFGDNPEGALEVIREWLEGDRDV